MPASTEDPDLPFKEELLGVTFRRPLDPEEAYLRSALRYRHEAPSDDTLGFLSFRQVALLLIVLGIRGLLAHDPSVGPYASDVYPEPISDAATRITCGVVRERWREAWGEGRTTRRRRGAKVERNKRRQHEAPKPVPPSKGDQPARTGGNRKRAPVYPAPPPEVETNPDIMGTPLSYSRTKRYLP